MKKPEEDYAPIHEAVISTAADDDSDDRKPAAKGEQHLEAEDERATSSENNEELIRQWEQEAHLHYKKSSWKGESLTFTFRRTVIHCIISFHTPFFIPRCCPCMPKSSLSTRTGRVNL